jgi:hypothetical protein
MTWTKSFWHQKYIRITIDILISFWYHLSKLFWHKDYIKMQWLLWFHFDVTWISDFGVIWISHFDIKITFVHFVQLWYDLEKFIFACPISMRLLWLGKKSFLHQNYSCSFDTTLVFLWYHFYITFIHHFNTILISFWYH